MSSTDLFNNKRRLCSAVAGAALLAVSGAASAEPASLTLEYTCPLPLIGEQPIQAQISADVPAEVQVGQATEPFEVTAVTTVNEDSRTGLTLVGSTTIEGSATSTSAAVTASGEQTFDVNLNVPQQAIPQTPGAFTVNATGTSPSLTFSDADVGEGQITVNELVLELTARTANGNVAPAPVGQFTANCTQNAGQDNVLASFEVVSGEPDPLPQVSIDQEEVAFGEVQSGLTEEKTVTVSNEGGAALGINGISIGGADASAFLQTNNCTTLASGESCAVNVTYAPSAAGSQSATLTVNSTDPENASIDIPLSGTSVLEPTAEISVDPQEVSFGTVQVGTSAEQAVTVSNLGDVALGVTSVTINGANSGDFMQSNNCTSVAPDATCNVTVTYTASVAEASNATLVIESDDPDAGSVEVPLSGQGDDGSSGKIDLLLNLQGSTVINQSDSTLPLNGTIDTELNLATGMFTGDLALEPTKGSFQVSRLFRHLKATAKVQFESVDDTTGTLVDGKLSATSTLIIKVPKVTVNIFGFDLPIGGGHRCQTIDPVNITLQSPEGEQFSPSSGGQVSGVYNLPPLEHCGGLTDILNLFLAGSGNTINLALTPTQQ